MSNNTNKYETVIGLEVHVQLLTETKAFCSCSTRFGAPPNTQVCPVCLGQPGVLPVLNRKAFEYSIKAALALGCDIQEKVKFDRKNYYYPDLPKNYQISQYDMPLAFNGSVRITLGDGSERTIGIVRAHMEEDAGKLLHDPVKSFSYVDLNRAGTPLLEIVSRPEMRSPDESHGYLVALKKIIKYVGVSDCNMEEGSLRCDANISIRPRGSDKLGNKVEIKNMNSFKAVKDALLYEETRQADILEEGGSVAQETRLWDEKKGATSPMRTKEESQDYRYFPEPDLVPFEVSRSLVEKMRSLLPELPHEKEKRFRDEYKLSPKDVEVLTAETDVADLFEAVSKRTDPQSAANWIKGEVLMHINEKKIGMKDLKLGADSLVDIIEMVKRGELSNLAAKGVLAECIETGEKPSALVEKKGLRQVSDERALESAAEKVIAANAKSVKDYKGGKSAALSFLVGQMMKETKGKANPKLAGDILRKKLEEK